jgi:hypothetical protein
VCNVSVDLSASPANLECCAPTLMDYRSIKKWHWLRTSTPYGLDMIRPTPGVTDWRSFERYARQYFSQLWTTELTERPVLVGDAVSWKFDLVSPDHQLVGDAKWLKNIAVPAAKWQAIAEYIWLLQKVPARRVFMVFGQDAQVAERYLHRVRPLTSPVEFYYLDGNGHRQL